MDRRDFYFKQPVTESELNGAFDAVEQAIWNIMTDQDLIGIAQAMQGAPTSPVATLNVTVSGPGFAYDGSGRRLTVSGSLDTVDCSKDFNNVTTAVAGAGNEKWLAVFIHFTRALSDPRIDGNSNSIFFVENESHEYIVVQSAEAPVGTAVRPALDPTSLLLFDVHRIFGQTQYMAGDIDVTRRQDTFVFNQSPLSIRAGTVPTAIQAMLTELNAHINTVGIAHPANAIATTAHGSGPITVPATDVQSSLNAIVDYLDTGVSIVQQVASIAALKAIGSASCFANEIMVVLDQGIFTWDPALIATSDNNYCIRPTDIANDSLAGRWVSGLRTLSNLTLDANARVAATNVKNGLIATFKKTAFLSQPTTGNPTIDIDTGGGTISASVGDLIVAMVASYCSPSSTGNVTPSVGYKDGAGADTFPGITSVVAGQSATIPTMCFTDFFSYTVVNGGTQKLRGNYTTNVGANINVEAFVLQFRP